MVALACAALATLATEDASAWCRTTTNRDFLATPSEPCDTTGLVLYWASKCVGYSVQRDASAQVDLATARRLAGEAFAQWAEVACPADPYKCGGPSGAHPSISAVDQGPVGCACVEFNKEKGNANIIMFRDEGWVDCDGVPKKDGDTIIALTTVTFSTDTGEIFDADMEINTANVQVTTDDTKVAFDLASILTHESGHFLGLAHTQPGNTAATMYARYDPGKTFMRDPSDDDRCAICAAYPPGRSTVCDPTPRRGLALDCQGRDPATVQKGCHCTVAGVRGDGAYALLGVALVLLGRFGRRHTLR